MGCGQSLPPIPRVVIIGGGYSGAYLAKLLATQTFATTTLVDPKDSMVHYMAALRCTVEPEFLKKMFIPYHRITPNFIRSLVQSIDLKKKKVLLKSGKTIGFDHLVIATGTSSSFPAKLTSSNPETSKEEAITKYKNFNDALKRSPRILIVGGNSAAVQFAGEVKTDYPDKQVILLHHNDVLVSQRLPDQVRDSIKEILQYKGVELHLDDEVSDLTQVICNVHCEDQKVKTKGGKTFEVDLVVAFSEDKPQTEFLQNSLGKGGAVTSSGFIKTTPTLQVEGFPGIYVMGDVTDLNEEKIPFTAKQHAVQMAKNLKLICEGELPNNYVPAPLELIVPVGCYDGAGVVGSKILDGDESRDLMGTNLFTDPTWNDLGLEPP